MKRNDSGITLLALIIMIIVLIIIASISVYEGRELIEKSKVQTVETCMLTIQAKAKAYAEEIESKIWNKGDNDKESAKITNFDNKGFFRIQNNTIDVKIVNQIDEDVKKNGYVAYELSENAFKNIGIDYYSNEKYIVVYNTTNYKKIDVIYKKNESKGIKFNGEEYYTLSLLKKALEE